MNFKEKYQEELNNINVPHELNRQILCKNAKKRFKPAYMRYAAAAVICVAALGVITNFNTISTIAKSLFGTFKIIVGNEELDFGEMETIEFDFDKFKENGAQKINGALADDTSLYKNYSSYDECILETNLPITVVNNASIYRDGITLHADSAGHMVRTTISGTHNSNRFVMNGRAETIGSTLESWGFGDTKAKVLEVYEYSKGNKAYILNYDTPGAIGVTVQIYFQQGAFLQQLYIGGETQKEAIQAGKDFLKDIVD